MTASARRRVLIVYSRVGGGHLSAARALAEELESTGRATPTLVDAYVECGRFPLPLFPAAYAFLTRHHPRLWAMVYHGSSWSRRVSPERVLRPFLQPGLERLLARDRPDLVVSVLPAVNGVLAEASATIGARLEVVLTDWHAVHRFWIASGVQHYTAPTDSALEDCVRFGAPAAAVGVAGIPVRRAFAAAVDQLVVRSESLAAVSMDPRRFTVVAMVGAEGSPRALRSIARLAQLNNDLEAQLLVICGRSEELRRQVERLPARIPLCAVGFVDNVADLMRAADVLVTKAGGLTLAEAFCCRVPVVVYDVLPGQEAGNLEYVLRQEAAIYAPNPDDLARAVSELYADPARRAALAERGARLARPQAAQDIAHGLLARLSLCSAG